MVSSASEMVRKLIPESSEVVDLSHTLEEDIPAYPTHARFGKTLYESYEYGDAARHYGLTLSSHEAASLSGFPRIPARSCSIISSSPLRTRSGFFSKPETRSHTAASASAALWCLPLMQTFCTPWRPRFGQR